MSKSQCQMVDALRAVIVPAMLQDGLFQQVAGRAGLFAACPPPGQAPCLTDDPKRTWWDSFGVSGARGSPTCNLLK